MQEKLIDQGKQAFQFSKQEDQQAESYMHRGILRTVQKYLLHLAVGLITLGVSLAVIFSDNFKERFVDYIKESDNKRIIYALVVLQVIILALNEFYTLDTKLTASTKKWINLLEDIVRSIVYVLLLFVVANFLKDDYSQTILVVSFVILIISGIIFFIFRLLKWVYYICGKGKKNLKPWEIKDPDALTAGQKKEIEKYMDEINAKKNGETNKAKRG